MKWAALSRLRGAGSGPFIWPLLSSPTPSTFLTAIPASLSPQESPSLLICCSLNSSPSSTFLSSNTPPSSHVLFLFSKAFFFCTASNPQALSLSHHRMRRSTNTSRFIVPFCTQFPGQLGKDSGGGRKEEEARILSPQR